MFSYETIKLLLTISICKEQNLQLLAIRIVVFKVHFTMIKVHLRKICASLKKCCYHLLSLFSKGRKSFFLFPQSLQETRSSP